MPGSIFPTEATFKGISQSTVGLVSSARVISGLITSILLLIIATPQNQKFNLISGGLVSAVSSLCFGLLVYGPNGVVFAVMCAIFRIICGAGGAFIWGTSIPVLVSVFPRLEERFPCLIVLSYSFGVLLGPVWGSLFYNWGGYITPFAVLAIAQSFISILSYFLVPGYKLDSSNYSVDPCSDVTVSNEGIYLAVEENNPNEIAVMCSRAVNTIDVNLGDETEVLTTLIEPRMDQKTNVSKFLRSTGVACLSLTIFSCGTTLGFTRVAIGPFLKNTFDVNQHKAGYYFFAFSALNIMAAYPVAELVRKEFGGLLFILSGTIGFIGYGGLSCSLFLMREKLILSP